MVTADDLKKKLGLAAHPEGGFYVQTYKSGERIPGESLDSRYGSARSTSTAIYYLLEPRTFSEMHRLKSDEIFHFYLGDPVEMLQLWPDGSSRRVVLGSDLASGNSLQQVVPKDVWQGSYLLEGGRFALLGCTVAPGFEFEDYQSGTRDGLIRQYPREQDLIAKLTRK
jgi:predicted cupin superfamily sugar epimerase